jgi:hypothetical protein
LDSARKVSVITELEDGKSVRITAPKSSAAFKAGGDTEEVYHFTGVFGPDTTQEAVYAQIAHPILTSVLGFECDGLIFSFGVTNSGKSYTIHGAPDQPGITPRVLKTVFGSLKPMGKGVRACCARAAAEKVASAADAISVDSRIAVDLDNYRCESALIDSLPNAPCVNSYGVQLSCLEIYNELIYDLLADLDTQKEPLKITLNSTGHYRVSGNKDVTVRSFEEALQGISIGFNPLVDDRNAGASPSAGASKASAQRGRDQAQHRQQSVAFGVHGENRGHPEGARCAQGHARRQPPQVRQVQAAVRNRLGWIGTSKAH